MGKYFNNDETFGIHSMRTVRIEEMNELFYLMKGGSVDAKGKLKQAGVLAYCDTKEEAESLLAKLIEL